jgi:hypothetical protein
MDSRVSVRETAEIDSREITGNQSVLAAHGILDVAISTGADPWEAAGMLIQAGVGWEDALGVIAKSMVDDPIGMVRAMSVTVDAPTIKSGALRTEVASALIRMGVHPLSVAMGAMKFTPSGSPLDVEKARGLAKRLGVNSLDLKINSSGILLLGARGGKGGWEGWPDGLRIVPTGVCLKYVGSTCRIDLPNGLVVAGDLDLDTSLKPSPIRKLPSALKVFGSLWMMSSSGWDREIPVDAWVGGRIYTEEFLPEETWKNNQGCTLADWRRMEAILEGMDMDPSVRMDPFVRREAAIRVRRNGE